MAQEITKSNYKDRSVGLILFGVLEILFGVVIGFMGVLVVIVSQFAKTATPTPLPWTLSLFYLGLAVFFICLGVGSIMARRWARALLLIVSWMWLLVGVIGIVVLTITLPNLLKNMAETQGSSQTESLQTVVLSFVGFFAFVFYLLIPGVLVLFYRSPHVKMTCEVKDPRERWTDKCPLPVLALSFLYAMGVLMLAIIMPAFNFIFPFFGTLLTGLPGALGTGVFLVVTAYMAYGFYKVQVQAWWTAVGFTLVGFSSALVTFSRVGLLEMYQQLNYTPE